MIDGPVLHWHAGAAYRFPFWADFLGERFFAGAAFFCAAFAPDFRPPKADSQPSEYC